MQRLEEYLLLDEEQPQKPSQKVEINFVSGVFEWLSFCSP